MKNGASGIEEYARNLLRELLAIDQKNEYEIFTNRKFYMPGKIFDFTSRFLKWPAVDELTKADLIFSPHFNILHSKKAPRIITVHDLSFIHHPYFFSKKQRLWHWLQNIKQQTKDAAAIVAVSQSTKKDLINTLGIPEEKIRVIYSGIPSTNAKFEAQNLQSVQDSEQPYILYLGTLEPRKNVLSVVRAFNILKKDVINSTNSTPNLLKKYKLILAGKIGWLCKDVLREIKKSPFRDDIIVKGKVSSKEREILYKNASVFVYPSFFEGFGFPPLEAQAAGCPVVASKRTALPEILGQSAVLINPWETSSLAEAIKKILMNSKFKQDLIKRGLENVKRFSWKKAAEQMLLLFYEVAK